MDFRFIEYRPTTIKPPKAQKAIHANIGNALSESNELTTAETRALIPIWILPISADARPASFGKGDKAKAVVLGFTLPSMTINKNIKAMERNGVNIENSTPISNIVIIAERETKAYPVILLLEYFFSSNRFV